MRKEELTEKVFEEIHKLEKIIGLYRTMAILKFPENYKGNLSRKTALHKKNVIEAALMQGEAKLKKLYSILDRVSNSDFDLCSSCGQKILTGHLFSNPETNLCLDCARKPGQLK